MLLNNKPLDVVYFLSNTKDITGKKFPEHSDEYGTLEKIAVHIEALKEIVPAAYHIEADDTCFSKLENLKNSKDNVFIINYSEGFRGSDREAQLSSILEFLGLPYSGGAPINKAVTLNKALAKQVFKANNLPTADFAVAYDFDFKLPENLNFPLFAKPVSEGSSIGVCDESFIPDKNSFSSSLSYLLNQYKQPLLIEEFLPGVEFSVGLLGDKLLPVISKHYPGDYNAQLSNIKYSSKVIYKSPAIIPIDLETKLIDLSKKAFDVTYCQDIARLDFRLDKDGNPNILEINAPPGISEGSSYGEAIKAIGHSRSDMFEKIIESALTRYNSYNNFKKIRDFDS